MAPIPPSTPIPPAPNKRKGPSSPPDIRDPSPHPNEPPVTDPPAQPGTPVPVQEPPARR